MTRFRFSLFRWFFGDEARAAVQYYREIGVMVPFGVGVFFLFCWMLDVWVRL